MNTLKRLVALYFTIGIALTFTACTLSENEKTSDIELSVSEIQSNTEKATVISTVTTNTSIQTTTATKAKDFLLSDVGNFSGQPYTIVNDNIPYFVELDMTVKSFESYSPLDSLGRCGVAFACIGQDIIPTAKRDGIGMIKPTGWHLIKYDNVDGKYLYNRCHLIGYQLSGENANVQNLITGTRYLNIQGMLPFENMVADYVRETDNHVLYRVTPIFDGDNLLANGVLMEGFSVEDSGDGICFNVFCYNAQPDIAINYANGDSECLVVNTEPPTQAPVTVPEATENTTPQAVEPVGTDYIVNTNTGKFHYPSCSSVNQMAEHNKMAYTGSRDDLVAQGYEPCKRCNP